MEVFSGININNLIINLTVENYIYSCRMKSSLIASIYDELFVSSLTFLRETNFFDFGKKLNKLCFFV